MRFPDIYTIYKTLSVWVHSEKTDMEQLKRRVFDMRGGEARWKAFKSVHQENATEIDDALQVSDLATLLEIFGIADIDTFIDLCCHCQGLDQPLYIPSSDREIFPYKKSAQFAAFHEPIKKGPLQLLAASGRLDGHRTMMERVELEPKGRTGTWSHYGHETVLVIAGEEICVSFDGTPLADVMMHKGDFLSFNSKTTHSAQNLGKTTAVLVVAHTMRAADYRRVEHQDPGDSRGG